MDASKNLSLPKYLTPGIRWLINFSAKNDTPKLWKGFKLEARLMFIEVNGIELSFGLVIDPGL